MFSFFQSKLFGWIIVAAIAVAVIFRVSSCMNEPKVSKENRTAKPTDTVNYKDLYKSEHLRVVQLQSENALSKLQMDTLRDRLSIKDKQLKSYQKTKVQILGGSVTGKLDSVGVITKVKTDSATGKTDTISHDVWVAEIKDNVISGTATVIPDLKTVTLTYEPIEIQINHAEIWKRRNMWGVKFLPCIGRKIYYVDAWIDNPLFKVIGLESYQINK